MADDPVVGIIGAKALAKDIRKLTDDVRSPLFKAIQAALRTAAEPVAAATRSALPQSDRGETPSHHGGQLVATVRSSGTRTGASVRMGSKRVPWAGWVEFGGTRHQPFVSAREFVKDGRYLFPAARGSAERSASLYSDALSRVFASSGVWTNPGTPPMIDHRLVTVDANIPPRFRPADLRVVRAITGQSLMAMVGGDDDADRMCALAFFALRRAEPDAAAEDLWELCEQADVEVVAADDGVDPTSGDGSTPSPLSATTGG